MYLAYRQDQFYKDVGTGRQLFIDDDVVAVVKNVTRRLHRPVKHPLNPLMQRDRPWEVVLNFRTNTFSVVRDPQDGLFKCWYEDYYDSFGQDKSKLFEGNRVYYAQSSDGLHWEKPPLGRHFVDGHNTNTVFSPPHEHASDCGIILDPADPDPTRRFKMVYYHRVQNINVPKKNPFNRHAGGLCLAVSANGLDWTAYPGNPIFPSWGGDVEILSYDPIDRHYVMYGRYGGYAGFAEHPEFDRWFAPVWPGKPEGVWSTRRRIYRTTSPDCVQWSKPQLWFEAGPDDNLDDGMYGFITWRADEFYLGFLNVLHQVDNVMEFYLLHSRDGLTWRRLQDHRAYVPRGGPASFDQFGAETPVPPIDVGDELWVYFGGAKNHHDGGTSGSGKSWTCERRGAGTTWGITSAWPNCDAMGSCRWAQTACARASYRPSRSRPAARG
ncbi:MAG: hypothetical protein FJ029_02115 [Actinobacteria bacterium]|nr:hypothetical protein [Actinomycetota bacterium]